MASELFRTSQVATEIYTRLTALEVSFYNPNRAVINAQIGTAYTLVDGDQSKFITLNNASAITVTLPAAAALNWAVGDCVDFAQLGAGQATFVAGSGATVHGVGTGLRVRYSAATALKIAQDEWLIIGDLA